MRGLPFSEYSVISSTATHANREAIKFEAGPKPEPQMRLILWPEAHTDWNDYKFEPIPSSELAELTAWP